MQALFYNILVAFPTIERAFKLFMRAESIHAKLHTQLFNSILFFKGETSIIESLFYMIWVAYPSTWLYFKF